MQESFEIRSCIEILASNTYPKSTQLISICSTVNKELEGIYTGGSSSFKRQHMVRYFQ